MKTSFASFLLITFIAMVVNTYAQPLYCPSDPEYYVMDRPQIRFDDQQVMLFNYRGFVCPRQYSMTSFTHVQFLPLSAPDYTFNLNFLDHNTGNLSGMMSQRYGINGLMREKVRIPWAVIFALIHLF